MFQAFMKVFVKKTKQQSFLTLYNHHVSEVHLNTKYPMGIIVHKKKCV